MTSKKSKSSKPDSRSKKMSRNSSANSSIGIGDKKGSQVDLQMSVEEIVVTVDNVEETVVVEPLTDHAIFIDEPTLTELIIERYEGDKTNGRFDGYGMAYFVNGNVYEGMFSEGTMNGTGKFIWNAESISYEGDFCFNEITGKGKYLWADGSSYEGDVFAGIRHGQGVYSHPSGKMYSGLWMTGKRHGIGIMNYGADGKSFYEGEWNQNIIEGLGFRQYKSGNTYEGEWYKGLRHGHGTMKWVDRNEQYTGQWKNGVQNGSGQHLWFVQRVKGSQYSLRNVYEGDFVNGKRHGYGSFTYPSGARYEGHWVNNKKCGMGEFVFKNGRNYEGVFEDDKVKEFPNVSLSGRDSPDLAIHRMQQAMLEDIDKMSARLSVCSLNTISPSFQLYLDHILMDPRILNPEEESVQLQKSILLHLSPIRKVYQFYSMLGDNESIDNTAVMTQMQFWRFLKDCRLHYNSGPTVAEFDRLLAESINTNPSEIIQNPTARIIFLSFINFLVSISYYVYADNYSNYEDLSGNLLVKCFEDLMHKNILPHSCSVGGVLYSNKRKTEEALTHFAQMFVTYKEFSYPKKNYPLYCSMKMRDFLVMMKKLGLINNNLTATEIVRILSLDDPNVIDGDFISLENEMTFYEFFEAMINCGTVFVTKDVIDLHLRLEEKIVAIPSETMDDSETEHTLTISSPITGDSNKMDLQEEDKPNIRNHGKPQSGKTKLSSPDSTNSKNRKPDPDKNSTVKKQVKTTKSPKTTNNRIRKTSLDKEPAIIFKPSESVVDIEKLSIPEVMVVKDDESIPDCTSPIKAHFPEEDIQEYNEERQFNFWTHQLHIFFYTYLFPAVAKYASISKRIEDQTNEENSKIVLRSIVDLTPTVEIKEDDDLYAGESEVPHYVG